MMIAMMTTTDHPVVMATAVVAWIKMLVDTEVKIAASTATPVTVINTMPGDGGMMAITVTNMVMEAIGGVNSRNNQVPVIGAAIMDGRIGAVPV